MNNNEIEKFKNELMKEHLVEDRHHALSKLKSEDAKRVVESMNEREIYRNVNVRQFEEDYIADYLRYLWDISEAAFWNHVKISLDINKGILWADHMFHFDKMCNVKIPEYVLITVLDFVVQIDKDSKQDYEAIGCVIKAQIEKFGRQTEIDDYISLLGNNRKNSTTKKIQEMISCECRYLFF
jgi:hypothetical protein